MQYQQMMIKTSRLPILKQYLMSFCPFLMQKKCCTSFTSLSSGLEGPMQGNFYEAFLQINTRHLSCSFHTRTGSISAKWIMQSRWINKWHFVSQIWFFGLQNTSPEKYQPLHKSRKQDLENLNLYQVVKNGFWVLCFVDFRKDFGKAKTQL